MEKKTAYAYLRYVRISPRKVKIVCDLIRGKDAGTAMAILMQTPKAASEPLILDDQIADLLITGIPTGIPVFDDAHAQTVGINFLSHKLFSSLMPFQSQPG